MYPRKKSNRILILCLAVLLMVMVATSYALIASNITNKDGNSRKKIGVLYMTLNNPYFEVLNQQIEAEVTERGDILIERDSCLDNETQIREIEEMIAEKVDIILLNSVDWKEIKPALLEAKEAGIPVIALDTDVYDSDLVISTIVSDNYHAGVAIAHDLMKKSQGGNILLMVQSSNKSARDRIQGFLDTLTEEGWPYEIVDQLECEGQLELAQPLVEELLEKNVHIDVVMGLNDPSALGAMAALDAKGILSDVLVYGVDGAPEAKAMIAKGLMEGSAAQSPTLTGQYAARYLYDILDGNEVQIHKTIPITLITKKNIDDYSLTNWE